MSAETQVPTVEPLVKKRLTLPVSHKVVEISDRELVGRDREQADIVRTTAGGGNTTWFHAMISRVLSFVEVVDGKESLRQLVKEDLDDMSTRDLDAIQETMGADPRFFAVKKGATRST